MLEMLFPHKTIIVDPLVFKALIWTKPVSDGFRGFSGTPLPAKQVDLERL